MPTGDGAQGHQGGSTVSITVVGASGDLAKKKIFPALFALFYEDCLPEVRQSSLSLLCCSAVNLPVLEFQTSNHGQCSILQFLVMPVAR